MIPLIIGFACLAVLLVGTVGLTFWIVRWIERKQSRVIVLDEVEKQLPATTDSGRAQHIQELLTWMEDK